MKLIAKNNGIFIFWDWDDVVVKSSPYLQEQVNEKTCFKTRTLVMLEQLKRNCEFLKEVVKKECESSFARKRLPNLKKFPIFNGNSFTVKYPYFTFSRMTKEQYEDIYKNPIKSCDYYIGVVDLLLNQFLEERDSFLEKDNLPKNKIIKYDYQKEMENVQYYTDLINNNKNILLKISEYCLKEVEKISASAKVNREIPDYGSLIKMDSNDILRDNDESENLEYFLYNKPIKDVTKVLTTIDYLDDIVSNFWEYLNPSREVIDYKSIHSLEHVNFDVVDVIKKLEDSPYVAGQAFLSHHNGARELFYKESLANEILPEIPFIGMRFHDIEHNGIRRNRTDKYPEADKYLNNDPRRRLLTDDSIPNNRMWEGHDAKTILYRKVTDAERVLNRLSDTGFTRITHFEYEEIEGLIKNYYLDLQAKQKIKK